MLQAIQDRAAFMLVFVSKGDVRRAADEAMALSAELRLGLQ